MKPIDRKPVLRKYPGKWVAFKNDRVTVVGVGDNAKEALKEAKIAGIKLPILFKVPQRSTLYVGASQE